MSIALDKDWPKTIFKETRDGVLLTMPNGRQKLIAGQTGTVKGKTASRTPSDGEALAVDGHSGPAVDKRRLA